MEVHLGNRIRVKSLGTLVSVMEMMELGIIMFLEDRIIVSL
jgi:hypothetical protein